MSNNGDKWTWRQQFEQIRTEHDEIIQPKPQVHVVYREGYDLIGDYPDGSLGYVYWAAGRVRGLEDRIAKYTEELEQLKARFLE